MNKGTVTIPIEEYDRLRDIEKNKRIENKEDVIADLRSQLEVNILSESNSDMIIKNLEYERKNLMHLNEKLNDSNNVKDQIIKRLEEKLKIRFPWKVLFTLIIANSLFIMYNLIW